MRYSINDYSISPKVKGWGPGWPTDRSADMARVTADRSAAKVNVHKRIARLVDMLLDETERRGYVIIPNQTGGFNNRQIANTHPPVASNHSWGLAVDLNWTINAASNDGRAHGNIPPWLPPLWGRHGFAWGGNYRGGFKDPMHLEFMGAPADADDMTRAFGLPPVAPSRPPGATYTVVAGDSLSRIAAKLHIPGGWSSLYRLNRNIIGPDPDRIHPGQVLRLR
jgi:hypothetical protein